MMTQPNRVTWAQTQPEEEVTLFDYWQVIFKRKWRIMALCSVMVGAALVVSLLLPKIYESTATLLPQLESNTGFGSRRALGVWCGQHRSPKLGNFASRRAGYADRHLHRYAQIENHGG